MRKSGTIRTAQNSTLIDSVDPATASFDEAVNVYGDEEVICNFAKTDWWNPIIGLSGKFASAQTLRYAPRQTCQKKTIALYQFRIAGGGGARVTAALASLFAEQKDVNGEDKYNVIVITDTGKLDNEYPLSPKAKRAFLPSFETSVCDQYKARFRAWRSVIEEYDV